MSKFLKLYNGYLKRYPTIVPITQTAALMGAGDVIAQFLIEKKTSNEYNLKRTFHFTFMGAALVGPALTVWYRFLARTFGTVGTPAVALKKVACDQGLFAPSFLPVFICSLGVLQGKSNKDIRKELEEKYVDILLTNYSIWPLANVLNFYIMPLQYQVLFANFVALFWNTYLSWKTQQISKTENKTELVIK